MPHEPPAPVVEPAPPRLELRGMLVEGRVTWFNVYNAETNESAWLRRGDTMASFVIKEYDAKREALILGSGQRSVSVAFKESRVLPIAGSAGNASAVASLALPAFRPAAPSLAPALPASENRRLEEVAEQIRQRRRERRERGEGSQT